MATKLERKYMAHYIDTTFSYAGYGNITWTPAWYRLGEDLQEYTVEMNPACEIEKNFLGDDVVVHTGYDMSGEAETFYAYVNDPLFVKLQDIIDNNRYGSACLTLAVEVQLWHGGSSPGQDMQYIAVLRPCYVVPTGYGGDTSGYQIPFTVQYLNNFIKHGLFAPNGSGSGTFTEIT